MPIIGGSSFSVPQIPRLAKGGLAYDETLAVIGDNPDSAINPEVVAPLNQLKAIMGNSNNDETNKLLKELINTVKVYMMPNFAGMTVNVYGNHDIQKISQDLAFMTKQNLMAMGG